MPANPQQARELFLHAVGKLPPEQWDSFVAGACKVDVELERQVRHLLQVHREAGSFLETPAVPAVIEELAGRVFDRATQAEPAGSDGEDDSLEFLAPSEKPGSLGRLGHYEVQEVIGRGGMGLVLRAFDEELHRVVAIKVMAQPLATNATARKRFKREAQAVAAVIHDHVVTLHAVEEANGLPYLVMQYIAGLSLQQRLDRDGPLELHEVLRIGMQTASGLAAAHAQGLIHRDIKPANILLENGVERVKITDFGLARAAADANLTQSGMVAGTPQYMSPEQAEGKAIDPRTDLFSLGSVLYAMCTGRAPFRASGTVAVLKRVCEERPTPIRETNPAIPDWLVEIIQKLHAKDPAQRYQSAAEVAELLGRHLAQVQHPSVVGQATNVPPETRAASRPSTRRRLAIAAAVLVCLVAGLSLTEAAGVTSLRATVIRIFTPEGTLVVETDDPAVKVTVEGDGDLVITGAGPQEVRLKAGSYRLKATKDGQPVKLDRDLVAISRGDRQIVRVRLEDEPPAAAVPKVERGAFVLLGGKGVAERKLDTLAEAVQSANNGDTIEVRGNGPFVCQPIEISGRAVTIRAGEGFRPVIKLSPNLQTDAALILEGLELHRLDRKPPTRGYRDALVFSWGASSLHVANCRFFLQAHVLPCIAGDFPTCTLCNCEFLSPPGSATLYWSWYRGKLFMAENCLQLGSRFLQFGDGNGLPQLETSLRLRRNTLAGSSPGLLVWDIEKARILAKADLNRVVAEASTTIFDAPSVLLLNAVGPFTASDRPITARQTEELFLRGLAWRDHGNLYALGSSTIARYSPEPVTIGPRKLWDWKQFWGDTNAKAIEGRVRYQGGDVRSKLRESPDRLTPDDFRLRPDSPGYKAGKDGKDLGADVDLVGPGPAYEQWKKTPEYQQWLKETGQVKK